MSSQPVHQPERRIDASSIEADIAFFEARLSLAGEHPDTFYQQAQIKTYQTLGLLLGHQLNALRPPAAKDGGPGPSAATSG